MDFNYYLFKSGGVNIILLKFDFKFFKYIYNWRVLLREQMVKWNDLIKLVVEYNEGVCIICFDEMIKFVVFMKCYYCFCEECIFEYFMMKLVCFVCNIVYGKLYGN